MGLHCLHRRVYPSKNLLEFRDSRTFFVYILCNDSSKHFFYPNTVKPHWLGHG